MFLYGLSSEHTQCAGWDISFRSRWWTVFLLARRQPHCERAHNETLIFFFFFFLLPSISLSLLHTICIPLSPSHTYTLIQHRQVGLICCIGQCQSSTLSCGNRGLMISILRLGRLCYIYFSCCALRVCGRSLPPAFYGFLTTSSDCYGDNSETGVILPHPEAFFN